MITFSIVTITYNAEAVLGKTVGSVLAQTYPHVEHIIVDGASKDGTVAVAEDYKRRSDAAAGGHTVSIKSEPDKGLYDAMNKGLARATGDYVLFLNAGDFFPGPSVLSEIVGGAALDNTPKSELPAVLYGNTDVVDDDGNFLFHRRLQPPETLSWRSFRHGMLVCHQAFYARVDIASEIPYDCRYRYSADVDWCIRVMKEAERRRLPLHNLHAVVANYTEVGQSTIHHKASLRERYRVMCVHYGRVSTFMMHLWFAVRLCVSRVKYRHGLHGKHGLKAL